MLTDPVTVGFPFLDDVSDPIIRLTGVGLEVRSPKDYYFDNKDRNIDSYIFQYTLEGSGILETGGHKYKLPREHGFFIYAPGDTKYYCDPDGGEWKFIFVIFMGRGIMPYFEKFTSEKGTVFSLAVDSSPIRRAMEMLHNAREGRLSDSLSASAAAFDFVCELCKAPTSSMGQSALTQKAVRMISENYHLPIGISDVAAALGVSGGHLSRCFAGDMGTTMIEYLTKIRINAAMRLLVTTDGTVDSVARACGFDNGNYFSKVFKRYTDMTPAVYRKNRRL